MNEIQIFRNEIFGEVRLIENEGKVMFVASDVAKSLGYSNPNDAIAMHCKSGNIANRYIAHENGFGGVNVKIIPESDVIRLIMRSNLPMAELYQDWVFEEVLPSIHKHGAYATAPTIDKMIADPDFAIKLFTSLKEEQQKRIEAENYNNTLRLQTEEQTKQLQIAAPKVKYYDETLSAKGFLTVNSIALVLGITANKLNKLLTDWNIQYKQSDCFLLYANYRDKGYAALKSYPYPASDGTIKTRPHLYWTEKGKQFIIQTYNIKTQKQ